MHDDATGDPVLNDEARRLFDPMAYATLSTINRDNSPQVSLVTAWIQDDEIVLFHRGWYQKLRNIVRNPHVALAIVPAVLEIGDPTHLPPYLVVHGIARVQEGDAGPWSEMLLDIVRRKSPDRSIPSPPMPDNGGWTTHITPEKLVGVGPWKSVT